MITLSLRAAVVASGVAMLLAPAVSPDFRPGARLTPQVDTITRRYDVRFGMTGYTGLIENQQCKSITDPAGYDSLSGTIVGVESTRPNHEPVTYIGVLQRKTKIDYCLAGANDTWCVVKLTGEAQMNVEVEVRDDSLAGAWLKATPKGPATSLSVVGNCAQSDKDEILQSYPDGESGGTPDGQEISETASSRFTVNGIRRLRVGTFPSTDPRGGWGLRVTRVEP